MNRMVCEVVWLGEGCMHAVIKCRDVAFDSSEERVESSGGGKQVREEKRNSANQVCGAGSEWGNRRES